MGYTGTPVSFLDISLEWDDTYPEEHRIDLDIVHDEDQDEVEQRYANKPNLTELTGPEYPQPGSAYPQPGSAYPQPGSAYPQLGSDYLKPLSDYLKPGSVGPKSGSMHPNSGPKYPESGSAYSQSEFKYLKAGSVNLQPSSAYPKPEYVYTHLGSIPVSTMNLKVRCKRHIHRNHVKNLGRLFPVKRSSE